MSNTITVCHIAQHRNAEYIGRKFAGRAASPLGNPFKVGRDGTGDQVMARYLDWLRHEYCKPGAVRDELHRLATLYQANGSLELGCWCRKDGDELNWTQCHGDMVKRAIEGIVRAQRIGAAE